jgi:uncharacterized protein
VCDFDEGVFRNEAQRSRHALCSVNPPLRLLPVEQQPSGTVPRVCLRREATGRRPVGPRSGGTLSASVWRAGSGAHSSYGSEVKGTRPLICPTCKRASPTGPDGNPFHPFCSERCRLVDLGAWLNGEHRISSPLSEEELDQGSGADRGTDDPPRRSH